MTLYALVILLGLAFYSPATCEVTQLKKDNIDNILAQHELVLINFYVDWCRYSNLMQPIFEEATQMVYNEFGEHGRVAMGKVDCDAEVEVSKRFKITKYPTLKISLNGDVMKQEYRGQRSTEALVAFVRDQLKDPVKEITNLEEVRNLSTTKRSIIGYFDKYSITSPEYAIYRRVAANLKSDCDFYVGFGEAVSRVHTGDKPTIVYRPDIDKSFEHEQIYNGQIHADELKIWAQEKCIPLVREITFDNAEELTEEGMPFMIMFYHPDKTGPIKDYKAMVESELLQEKQNVNFLIADGQKFAHPLEHLDKTLDDLPVIAIDSFRHMYLFPEFNDIFKPGKLKKFVADLHSGKLHREFHYGPDPSSAEEEPHKHEPSAASEHEPSAAAEHKPSAASEHEPSEHETTHHHTEHPTEKMVDDAHFGEVDEVLPDSTFIKLAPSEKRYTLVRNEL